MQPTPSVILSEEELHRIAFWWDSSQYGQNQEWRFRTPKELMLFYQAIKKAEQEKILTEK